jgi:transcriptional regulator with XRE-family HTH domain
MNRGRIAAAVRRARVAAGLTQAELAGRTGTTQSAVSRLESGRLLPTLTVLERVAAATGRTITVVLGAAGPVTPPRRPMPTKALAPAGRPLPSRARERGRP